MGKGDKKTKKGKIAIGSYGNSRKRNSIKTRMKRAAASRKTAETGTETPAKSRRTIKKEK